MYSPIWFSMPSLLLLSGLFSLTAQEKKECLPGTTLLEWTEEDPSVRIMDGAHSFVERKITEATQNAPVFPLDPKERESFIDASRKSLAQKLGVVDQRLKPHLEFIGDSLVTIEGEPASTLVTEGPGFVVHQVRWAVLPEFSVEGLYVNPVPRKDDATPAPLIVLMPDADDTPEDLLGLTSKLAPSKRMALRFALAGFRMLIPSPVNRSPFTGPSQDDESLKKSAQSRREWLYRQAFQMGRHPIGYDVQTVLAAVDWFGSSFPGGVASVAGYGEGGRAALYAAALDPRIGYTFVSGAFAPRDQNWAEPIYRNIFHLLPDHGDANVAALISGRTLIVEHTEFPEVKDQKGDLTTPQFSAVQREWKRIASVIHGLDVPSFFHLTEAHDGARGDSAALAGFLQSQGLVPVIDRTPPIALLIDQRTGFDPEARQERIFYGIQNHVQMILDASERTREEFFRYAADPHLRPGAWSTDRTLPTVDPTKFIQFADGLRSDFEENYLGVFDEERLPLNPRTRKLKETDAWVMWEVGLDVYPEFEAWGVLLIPKGIKQGERRAVVVCQHGRNGVPRDWVDNDKSAYGHFAARLAESGYIAYAPHNLYRGEDRYRWLDRKANQIGGTLFTFLVASHRQHIDWLKSLPEVDPARIAFYGISYGGESAMRIPAVIPDYCLSVCSGDFNQWTRKVADPDFPRSFMCSIEWEMPYWNLGNTYDYAEMSSFIFPRPFFVERGHHDTVSQDSWVAHEYAKVRQFYACFGLAERTGIEFFHGGHSVRGEGSFAFLRKFLGKP